MLKSCFRVAVIFVALAGGTHADQVTHRSHALSMFDDVKYGSGFGSFDYVNPHAPKGGELRLATVGTFDSLNPFILKGVAAAGTLFIYNRLLTKSLDEPFTEYGQLVESIECPEDRSWVTFTLRREARWHDGKPVTPEDVLFSFDTLTTKGLPFFRTFYADVTKVEKIGNHQVKFSFKSGTNRELPLIIGQMRVLPKHYWENRDFGETTLEPPLGSGPYRIEAVDPGRSITYRRVAENWDRNLAVQAGQNNFELIRYDYYRDDTVAIEALKAGEYDFRVVGNATEWSTAYNFPPVEAGWLVKEMIPHQVIRGMQGFCFNTRRSKFADPKVRQALSYAFDFEWTNARLLHNFFVRSKSYWNNSELASSDLPEGPELEVLEGYRGRIPDEIFTASFNPPATDGSGDIRSNLRKAQRLLAAAGWRVADNKLTQTATGAVMTIEFLLVSPAYERIIGPLQKNLERLGIESRLRTVDSSQYQNRLQEFDYDVIIANWRQTLSPGNEQRNFWSSETADFKGSRNYAGIADEVVDELVERVIAAESRQMQVALTRALDRVLLRGHYVIPGWYSRDYRLVYWDKFGKPAEPPKNGLGFPHTWWHDADRAAKLRQQR